VPTYVSGTSRRLKGRAAACCVTKSGFLPPRMIVAASAGNLAIVRDFFSQRADIEAKDGSGYTALIEACRGGHLHVVRFLLEEAKANVETKGRYGCTALIWAAEFNHLDIVTYLVQVAHADVNSRDDEHSTPAHVATGHLDLVKYLMEDARANIEARDNHGQTCLLKNAQFGCLQVVRYLVEEAKADIEAKSNSGQTALLAAASWGCANVVEYMLETAKADAEARCNNGLSAIGWAQNYSSCTPQRQNDMISVVAYLKVHAEEENLKNLKILQRDTVKLEMLHVMIIEASSIAHQ